MRPPAAGGDRAARKAFFLSFPTFCCPNKTAEYTLIRGGEFFCNKIMLHEASGDTLALIVNFFSSDARDIGQLGCVCKALSEISRGEAFWRRVCSSTWKISDESFAQ